MKYGTVGLYDHNANSYDIVKKSFDNGEDVVGIVHATGTGKSYNALQLAYDNKDKKIIYVVPSNGIREHLNKIIEDNPNLNLKRDFPNLEFKTYQSFISLNDDDIKNIDCDLLILDEFHHIGAPIWGNRINKMINTHPDMKIFGMTAYTVRDRGTSYERDMANPDTEELFSKKIKSRYDLCDAMIDGVLPKPIYKSAYTNIDGFENKLEEKVQKLDFESKEYQEYMSILKYVKKRIHEAPSIPSILKKSIKPNGKYIYFCPLCFEEGINDIETIKKQATEWFKQIVPEEDLVIYTSTSDMGIEGKLNRNAFYDDITLGGEKVDNKLRIMFAINQYNEGIHAPNIDGVIMGRGTSSDIIYFEQLGRALSVRGNTKEKYNELEKYTIEELINMCKEKDIHIKDNTSKEEIIEKLIAPTVIDLTNNYEFIKELENNLRDKLKLLEGQGLNGLRNIKIKDASFDIEIENIELFEMLKYVMSKLTMTWDDYYALAKVYYEEHGNLDIPQRYVTEEGIKLGSWIGTQRKYLKDGFLNQEKIDKLNAIGMIWDIYEKAWDDYYVLAKAYYEEHGNLEILQRYVTEDGINLGNWINTQRHLYKEGKLSKERINKLNKIGMIWETLDYKWNKMYNYSKSYYEKYGNLNVPYNYVTEDDSKLGIWIGTQRKNYKEGKLSKEKIDLLNKIGMIWNSKEDAWYQMYEYAKEYYEKHGNLLVSKKYIVENGNDLRAWIANNRTKYKEGKLSKERIDLLNKIGMVWNTLDEKWYQMYECAKAYYEEHGNLDISSKYIAEDGLPLGDWLSKQKVAYKQGKLSKERIDLLNKIGMVWNALDEKWYQMYELATAYYIEHGNLEIPKRYATEDGIKLGAWLLTQRDMYKQGKLSKERIDLLNKMGMSWDPYNDQWEEMYKYAEEYYEEHGNLNIPLRYVTEDRVKLGLWIGTQRKNYKEGKLSKERINKLTAIGIIWDIVEHEWNEMYEYAREYYIKHGNLNVSPNYVTEDGANLGTWINTQRHAYKGKAGILTPERIKKLEDIDMKWFINFTNNKLQQEIITKRNTLIKQKEILNRVYSLLCNYNDNEYVSKEEINKALIKQLKVD